MQSILHTFVRVLLIVLCVNTSVRAQQDSITVNTPKLYKLKSFIDSTALAGMEKYKIPGAVISIITDSSLVYYNGYGYTDLENQIPTDKDKSIFRIASITKTFTAMAALQLVEEGKLDLYKDIRTFLPDDDFDFLSETPITLHHLLTHTAGFDLTDTGDAALTADAVIPLEEMARRRMPDRVHEPGSVHSYSNFGYTLVGYLIQEVSGMSYEDYIREKLLVPLNMKNTGIRQPLPEPYKTNLSKSYVWNDGQKALERDYTNTLPGGGIISSAKDMTNYMLMHLNAGQFEGQTLLSPEGHKTLTTQHYGSQKTKYGICYAFFENRWTGRRSIEHSGGQLGFVSLMILIPEIGTGIFITQNNRKEAGGFRYDMARSILDTLVGSNEIKVAPLVPPDNFDDIAHNYTGVYKQLNYPTNTFEKAIRLFGSFSTEYKIEYNGDGRISTYGDNYVMVDDHLFQMDNPKNTFKMEFLMDDSGKAQTLFIGTSSYERIGWLKKKRVQQMFLFISMVILLILFLSRPIVWISKRIRKKSLKVQKQNRGLRQWMYWTGSLLIIAAIGFIGHFAIYRDQLSDFGIPWSMKVVFLISTIGFLLTFFSPYFIWKNWRSTDLRLRNKILNSLVIISCIIVSTLYYVYNIVGFQYY